MSDKNQLVKVLIHAFEDKDFRFKSKIALNPISLPVNPEGFTQKYSLGLDNSRNRDLGIFKVNTPRELKLDFIFDGTQTIQGYVYNGRDISVKAQLEIFLDAVYRKQGADSYSRFLKVQWGDFIFHCVLADLELNYSLFKASGEPLRILVSTTFLDIQALEEVKTSEGKGLDNQNLIKKSKEFLCKIFLSSKKPDIPASKKNPKNEQRFSGVKKNLIVRNDAPKILESKNYIKVNESKKNKDRNDILKNIGVILLHPFLNEMFIKLDLIKGSAFKTHKTRSKGVLLIHYLASGKEDISLDEMEFPMLFCDFPANLQLDLSTKLSQRDKEESNRVIQVAIEHWKALKTTSPNGLRSGFLMRNGNLKKGKNNWKILMEKKSIDVLLDQLPWNLHMIKLPWQNHFWTVEWR